TSRSDTSRTIIPRRRAIDRSALRPTKRARSTSWIRSTAAFGASLTGSDRSEEVEDAQPIAGWGGAFDARRESDRSPAGAAQADFAARQYAQHERVSSADARDLDADLLCDHSRLVAGRGHDRDPARSHAGARPVRQEARLRADPQGGR